MIGSLGSLFVHFSLLTIDTYSPIYHLHATSRSHSFTSGWTSMLLSTLIAASLTIALGATAATSSTSPAENDIYARSNITKRGCEGESATYASNCGGINLDLTKAVPVRAFYSLRHQHPSHILMSTSSTQDSYWQKPMARAARRRR